MNIQNLNISIEVDELRVASWASPSFHSSPSIMMAWVQIMGEGTCQPKFWTNKQKMPIKLRILSFVLPKLDQQFTPLYDGVTLKTPHPRGCVATEKACSLWLQVNPKSFFLPELRITASNFPWIVGSLLVTKREISKMEVSLMVTNRAALDNCRP